MLSNPNDSKTVLERQQWLQQQHQRRVARKLHDIVSQKLTLLSLQLSMASVEPQAPPDWSQSCRNWSLLTLELGQSLRDIMNELKPKIIDETGLIGALQWFANAALPSPLTCRVIAPSEPVRLPVPAANEVYSICRDIFSGLFATSGARTALLEIQARPGFLRIMLWCSQSSFPRTTPAEFLQTWLIPERMQFLDGTVEIESAPNSGTSVTLSIRMPRQEPMLPFDNEHIFAVNATTEPAVAR